MQVPNVRDNHFARWEAPGLCFKSLHTNPTAVSTNWNSKPFRLCMECRNFVSRQQAIAIHLIQALTWTISEAVEGDADIVALWIKRGICTRIWTLCCWCIEQNFFWKRVKKASAHIWQQTKCSLQPTFPFHKKGTVTSSKLVQTIQPCKP